MTAIRKIISAFLVLLMAANIGVFVYAQPTVLAPAAIALDFYTGEILFERNAHVLRPPASMTKAMTAFVVYEEIERGNITLETTMPVSAHASRVSNSAALQGNPLFLPQGIYISVDTLLHLMMLPSSNGACVVVAEFISGSEQAFVQRMNESAAAIGMTAEFTNVHGALPHYTNAYSMALLVRTFIQRYPDILRVTSARTMNFNNSRFSNTNLLFSTFPYAGADGFRTGTTREAGFCLAATAERDGRRIITVVMGNTNNDGRYGDSRRLLDFGFAEAQRRGLPLYTPPLEVFINGEAFVSDIAPLQVYEQIMLPLRNLMEMQNFEVMWSAQNNRLHLFKENPALAYEDYFVHPFIHYFVDLNDGLLTKVISEYPGLIQTEIHLQNIEGNLFISAQDYVDIFLPGHRLNIDANVVTIAP